eukprot:SAG11_NODE_679_length_7786_cov_6.173670_4_plen_200_part_00
MIVVLPSGADIIAYRSTASACLWPCAASLCLVPNHRVRSHAGHWLCDNRRWRQTAWGASRTTWSGWRASTVSSGLPPPARLRSRASRSELRAPPALLAPPCQGSVFTTPVHCSQSEEAVAALGAKLCAFVLAMNTAPAAKAAAVAAALRWLVQAFEPDFIALEEFNAGWSAPLACDTLHLFTWHLCGRRPCNGYLCCSW